MKTKTNLWKRPASSTAGFLDTALTLRDSLIESHLAEYSDSHGGDATHKGPAPEACSYCQAIQEHDQIIETARKYTPPTKAIECRGRSGYFNLAKVEVWNIGKKVSIDLSSKTPYRDAAPIMIQGNHDDVEQLLLHLLIEVQRQKAAL